jgi:hypothetical protein
MFSMFALISSQVHPPVSPAAAVSHGSIFKAQISTKACRVLCENYYDRSGARTCRCMNVQSLWHMHILFWQSRLHATCMFNILIVWLDGSGWDYWILVPSSHLGQPSVRVQYGNVCLISMHSSIDKFEHFIFACCWATPRASSKVTS